MSHPEHGATLTEIMVALAVLAIVVTIGVPNLQTWLVRIQVATKADAVLNGLQLARAEALKRNARVYFTLSGDSAWTLGCVTAVGDLNGDGLADCPTVIQSKSGSEGGSATTLALTPADATTVTFGGIGLVTANADGSAMLTQVDVSKAGGGETRILSVRVTTGGQSRTCVPAADAHYATTDAAKRC